MQRANSDSFSEDFISVLYIINSVKNHIHLEELKNLCINVSYNLAFSLDTILICLKYIDWVRFSKSSEISKTKNFPSLSFESSRYFEITNLLIVTLIRKLKEEKEIKNIFPNDAISYDEQKNQFRIINNFIPLSFSWCKKTLLLLDFFSSATQSYLFVNEAFGDLFESTIINEIIEYDLSDLVAGLSFEEFKKKQSEKEKIGFLAEQFVLSFEYKRLSKDPRTSEILHVSKTAVDAGFDILSFNNPKSKNQDRFIEVKAYLGSPHFYLSLNELKTSKRLGANYYIYLVDINRMSKKNYEPQIFGNAYHSILIDNENWNREDINWLYKKSRKAT
jgi:hypothetical protein